MERDVIFQTLIANGFTPYICGGMPRDIALGVSSKDMDIEVYGCSIEQLETVLAQFGKIDTVGKKFGVVKLTTPNGDYDFSVPRRDNKVGVGRKGFEVEFDLTITPKEAASRRDYTFNAMFIDASGKLLDPHNGLQDLIEG